MIDAERVPKAVEFAQALAVAGFGIIEVYAPNGVGCTCSQGAECPAPGKHPVGENWQKLATRSPHTITKIVGRRGQYGVIPWRGERGLVADIDHPDKLPGGRLPATMKVETSPGRGHAYYRLPEGFNAATLPATAPWGEVRVEGASRHVVGPYSRHAGGGVYLPHGTTADIATIPTDVLASLFPPKAPGLGLTNGTGYQLPAAIHEGSRYEAIRDYVASRYMRGLTQEEVWAGVRDVLAPTFAQPLTDADLRSRFDRAWHGTAGRLGDPMPAGAPVVALEAAHAVPLATISTSAPPPMLLDRLDPEGHTILYGTGGIGKGALACWWIVGLARAGERVLILDYEGHSTEWARRIASLAPDATAGVWYLAPTGSLPAGAEAVRADCETLGITYVVVDSAVMACGNDPLKPETARAYGEGILRLGRPVLTLAHVTKLDDARYPFGSIFWHNLARTTWSLTADGDTALLTHRKGNNYARHARQTVTMTWLDNQLREVWERSAAASLADEIAAVLADTTDLTLAEIVAELSTDDRRVNRKSAHAALKRGTGPMGRFTCRQADGETRWRLSA